jgi:tetratricopeptide (TPR) repeat protein
MSCRLLEHPTYLAHASAYVDGDIVQAIHLIQTAIQTLGVHADPNEVAYAYFRMAELSLAVPRLDDAERFLLEAERAAPRSLYNKNECVKLMLSHPQLSSLGRKLAQTALQMLAAGQIDPDSVVVFKQDNAQELRDALNRLGNP